MNECQHWTDRLINLNIWIPLRHLMWNSSNQSSVISNLLIFLLEQSMITLYEMLRCLSKLNRCELWGHQLVHLHDHEVSRNFNDTRRGQFPGGTLRSEQRTKKYKDMLQSDVSQSLEEVAAPGYCLPLLLFFCLGGSAVQSLASPQRPWATLLNPKLFQVHPSVLCNR